MSSAPGEQGSKPVCWNCDEAADEVIRIAIQPASERMAALPLCRACYGAVYLPLAEQEPSLRVLERRHPSLLIVDDDAGIRGLLLSLFQGEGFRVDTATNGLEALRKARAEVPDAILLDLRMPVMSGREFLAQWRQTTPDRSVPVLAMSAYDMTATAEELGVQAFLPKPFSMDALLSTVDHLVGPVALR
jgi:CheY-like chemotaxis protein